MNGKVFIAFFYDILVVSFSATGVSQLHLPPLVLIPKFFGQLFGQDHSLICEGSSFIDTWNNGSCSFVRLNSLFGASIFGKVNQFLKWFEKYLQWSLMVTKVHNPQSSPYEISKIY